MASTLSRLVRARVIALTAVAAAVGIALLWSRPPHILTIETGPAGGSYYLDAQSYQRILRTHGIKMVIRERPNSLEIVRDVADPQTGVDVGFIAQDVSATKDAPLYGIGQIELQPLFIFSNAALGRRAVLDDLRGRRIVMPPADSATSDAAIRVFRLYDITPDNTAFTFMPLGDAAQALQAGKFDAGVFMLAPENPAIRSLASDSSLHLVPIYEAKAVANHLPFLQPVLLPRGIYNIADAIPPAATPMVAAPVGVVVHAGLHPYLVYALLEAMSAVHRQPTFLNGAGEFPTLAGSQLPVDPSAQEFYRSGIPWIYRELPAWLASASSEDEILVLGLFALGGLITLAMWLANIGVALLEAIPIRRGPPPAQPTEASPSEANRRDP